MAQEVNSKAYDLTLYTLLSHDAKEIGVSEAKQMGNAVFIDSRGKGEYNVSRIPNALWVGFENPKLEQLEKLEKDTPLIIYCSVGYRSEKIALQLEKKGFTQVYNLYGGIFEWVNQGNTIVDSDGEETDKVHAYNRIWGVWLNKGEKVY
jgi:rhodanese-related sulfurtransferase